MNRKKERNLTIDYLRFIGITLVVLAHVEPPELLFNFRCFDVCLMVFVSGLAYSGRKTDFTWNFFFHRFKRLVIPVYLFLSFYFVVVFIAKCVGVDFGIRWKHVVGSYLLTEGIGFVWIIKVFLLIALLTPFLNKIEQSITNTLVFFSVLMVLVTIVEIVIQNEVGAAFFLVREYVYYAAGYSVLFLLGLRVIRMNTRNTILILAGFVPMLVICAFVSGGGNFWQVSSFKYPPQLYYVMYGVVMSILMYLIFEGKVLERGNSQLLFIARNTIWIYLWHIPFVQITGLFLHEWYLRYVIVYFGAVMMCFLQTTTIGFLRNKYGAKSFYKFLIG